MSNLQFETDLTSLEPYITGKKFTGVAKNVPRLPSDVLEDFLTLLEEDPIAKAFFETYDLAKDFYDTMTDFQELVPKQYQSEVFYAAKNGHYYKQIPAFCEYVLRKSWELCDGIPNLIFKIVPIAALKTFCQENYFVGGVTLRDAVCNICCEEYNPVSMYQPFNKLKDFTEIYIPSTDMVAAVPEVIASQIPATSVSSIVLTDNGLSLEGHLLRTMANKVGAVNSFYDLRKVL